MTNNIQSAAGQQATAQTAAQKTLLVKVLAIVLGVLVLHSVWLWWSLTPSYSSNSSNSLAQLRLLRGAELPKQPKGDLFVKGRERQDEDNADSSAEVSTAPEGDYALLAVLTIGKRYYALFDNGAEQQKLALGDTLPGIGIITHIDRRRVKITNPNDEGDEQQFMLFPVLQPKSEQEANEET